MKQKPGAEGMQESDLGSLREGLGHPTQPHQVLGPHGALNSHPKQELVTGVLSLPCLLSLHGSQSGQAGQAHHWHLWGPVGKKTKTKLQLTKPETLHPLTTWEFTRPHNMFRKVIFGWSLSLFPQDLGTACAGW